MSQKLTKSNTFCGTFNENSPNERCQYENQGEEYFISNGSCFATRRETLLAGSIIGEKCAGFPVKKSRYIDIDNELDLEIARTMLGIN